MTSLPATRKAGLNSGWILVTGLLTLCVLGTWLTVRNYRDHVFCSTGAVVLENQWPENRIAATFLPDEASHLRAGQPAKITVGGGGVARKGVVLSVANSEVIIRLTQTNRAGAGIGGEPTGRRLAPGTRCKVTIDTTIPADAATAPSSSMQ